MFCDLAALYVYDLDNHWIFNIQMVAVEHSADSSSVSGRSPKNRLMMTIHVHISAVHKRSVCVTRRSIASPTTIAHMHGAIG